MTLALFAVTAAAAGCEALAPQPAEVRAVRYIEKVWVTFDAADLMSIPKPAAGARAAGWNEILTFAQPPAIERDGKRYLLAHTHQQVDANAAVHTQVNMPTRTLIKKAVDRSDPLGIIIRRRSSELVLSPEAARTYLKLTANDAAQ